VRTGLADIGKGERAIAGMMGQRVQENEEGTQGPKALSSSSRARVSALALLDKFATHSAALRTPDARITWEALQ